MLDITWFRVDAGGDPDVVRESQRRRGAEVGLVSEVVALDERWRAQLRQIKAVGEAARSELEAATLAIKRAALAGTAAAEEGETKATAARRKRELAKQLGPLEETERALRHDLHAVITKIGVLVHEHAPLRPTLLSSGGNDGQRSASEGPLFPVTREVARQALFTSGWAELSTSDTSGDEMQNWQARGAGLLAQQNMVNMALATAQQAGYSIISWPIDMSQSTMQKLRKLRRDRGEHLQMEPLASSMIPLSVYSSDTGHQADEVGNGPIGALHSASWIFEKDLPLRYAYVVDGCANDVRADSSSGPHVYVSEIWPDDGSAWQAWDQATSLCQEVHARIGLLTNRREAHTGELRHAEARAVVLEHALHREHAESPCPEHANAKREESASSIALARVWCSEAFSARWLGIRCGGKAMGERNKRYVHTLSRIHI